jgi:hypothetical protein
MKYLLVIMSVFLLQGCAADSDEKYDLKSPCVSADQDGGKANPCQRRRPVNQGIS